MCAIHRKVKPSSLTQAANTPNSTCSATGEPGLLVRRMPADRIRTQENGAGKGTHLKTVWWGAYTVAQAPQSPEVKFTRARASPHIPVFLWSYVININNYINNNIPFEGMFPMI